MYLYPAGPYVGCLFFSTLLLSSKINWTLTMSEPNHAFWQRLVLPQEERDRPWDGKGYRWFRASNVVPLEQYRHHHLRAEATDGNSSGRDAHPKAPR